MANQACKHKTNFHIQTPRLVLDLDLGGRRSFYEHTFSQIRLIDYFACDTAICLLRMVGKTSFARQFQHEPPTE